MNIHPLPKILTPTLPPESYEHNAPRLTFGLEQEFNFAVLKSKFHTFDDTQPNLEPISRKEDQSSSHNTGSEKMYFLRSHAQYVLALLNHEIPHDSRTYGQPTVFGKVISGEAKNHGYDKFTLVLDDSVMPKWDGMVKALYGVDPHMARTAPDKMMAAQKILAARCESPNLDVETVFKEIKETYDRVGLELVSQILDYNNVKYWMECVKQIESDLAWNQTIPHGAWTDDWPHLHVHMAMRNPDLSLRTIQNVLILYGLFEPEIEQWHPASQRDSDFCLSLRTGTDLGPYTPHSFAQNIYATKSMMELRTLVYPKDKARDWQNAYQQACGVILPMWMNYMQVNISLERKVQDKVLKATTLEFRQLRGTLNAEEIKWWVLFCGHLVLYANFLKEIDMPIGNIEIGARDRGGFDFLDQFTRESILKHISFPDAGQKFFHAKKKEYAYAETERWRRLDQKVIEERIERVASGERIGKAMEKAIGRQSWFINDSRAYKKALSLDEKHQGRLSEQRRIDVRNLKRERERIARGDERRMKREIEKLPKLKVEEDARRRHDIERPAVATALTTERRKAIDEAYQKEFDRLRARYVERHPPNQQTVAKEGGDEGLEYPQA